MDRLSLALCFLLLCVKASVTHGVPMSQPAEPREYPCPLDTDIAPCICTVDDDTYDLYMDCSDVATDQELVESFNKTFPFTTFNTLTIDQTDAKYDDYVLNVLSQFSFGEVSFEHVDIRGTTLTSVIEGAFENSHDTLISLRLQSNEISYFTFEVINDFTKLTSIYLQGNAFDGTPIKPISSATLRVLNLDSNPMVNVPGDFVSNCPSLKQLLLRNTGQTAVPVLDESPISMIDGLEYIIKVDFAFNSLTTLLTNTFHTSLEDKTVQTIDLSHNDISTVFPNFVTGLVGDAETLINLASNSIELMDQVVWEDIFTEVGAGKVDMSDNPLSCGCEIAWLIESPLMDVLSDETRCYTGDKVSELPPEAFVNC